MRELLDEFVKSRSKAPSVPSLWSVAASVLVQGVLLKWISKRLRLVGREDFLQPSLALESVRVGWIHAEDLFQMEKLGAALFRCLEAFHLAPPPGQEFIA